MKIAILCILGLEGFLHDIVGFLKTRCEVKTCFSFDEHENVAAIQWADVVWIEWCNELAVRVTELETILEGKRVICRLHSYEALSDYVLDVNWRMIDDLIFVASHVEEVVLKQIFAKGIPFPNVKTHFVPNGIDLSKFDFLERSKGKNLAMVANISDKKGPMLLIHAFFDLYRRDSEYKLFVAGDMDDPRYSYYLYHIIEELGLEKSVSFDGFVEDINAWLRNKNYIVCSSPWEGHPVGIMEAMACGIKPVIHNFVGAKQIFPEKFIWDNISEFVLMITEGDYSSIEYRNFIESHYSLEKQLATIENIVFGTSTSTTLSPKWQSEEHEKEESEILSNGRVQEERLGSSGKVVSPDDIRRYYNNFLEYLKEDHEEVNPRHVKVKQSLQGIIQNGMKVLDIGCGTGITSKFMGELGARVVGVDISDELIAFAKTKSAHDNVEYVVEDATELRLNANFDAVTIVDCMEHIPRERIDAFVHSVCRHASRRAVVYLNVPDARHQRYVKKHCPEKRQIIDEDYDSTFIASLFKTEGFELYHVAIYGIEVPVQYNEYLFTRMEVLEDRYEQILLCH
jgi:glycosyltransferase involved in cell wall biosynthesis/2-polyprenyl-3-methyl-5-hydroxy-6-metoxy-1,4-benzoquinol methylase